MENIFLRPKDLAKKLGISTTTIWRWVKDSNRNFPQPIKLTPTITVFNGLEIEVWIKKQFQSHKAGGNDA
jgi:predicted DNA-binding transcriptional regulator AlpA